MNSSFPLTDDLLFSCMIHTHDILSTLILSGDGYAKRHHIGIIRVHSTSDQRLWCQYDVVLMLIVVTWSTILELIQTITWFCGKMPYSTQIFFYKKPLYHKKPVLNFFQSYETELSCSKRIRKCRAIFLKKINKSV